MKPTRGELEANYREKSDDSLLDLYNLKTLTPVAQEVLQEEIDRRKKDSSSIFSEGKSDVINQDGNNRTSTSKKINKATVEGNTLSFRHDETKYKWGKLVSKIIMFSGWISVLTSGWALLEYGFSLAIGMVVSGLMLIAIAYITIAVIDNAENTREILRLIRAESNDSNT